MLGFFSPPPPPPPPTEGLCCVRTVKGTAAATANPLLASAATDLVLLIVVVVDLLGTAGTGGAGSVGRRTTAASLPSRGGRLRMDGGSTAGGESPLTEDLERPPPLVVWVTSLLCLVGFQTALGFGGFGGCVD